MWHEFILYTRAYEQFCRRAWHFTCHEEHINPLKPARLPLLFALDTKLHIAG
nr:hypothetical protein [uncultured Duganella sp.]